MLYKFLEKKYLDSFFKTGCIRIGTLHNFQDEEEHGNNRGDKNEGTHNLKRGIDKPIIMSNNEPIISEIFKFAPGYDDSSTISGVTLIVPRISPNGFIFCTSTIYNDTLFKKWHDKEKADACYEITNVKEFYSSISKKIKESANLSAISNITYIKTNEIDYQSSNANKHPAFTKLEKYKWQSEHRALWTVRGPCPKIEPWIIYVPEAIQHCRPYAHLTKKNNVLRCIKY